jgi:hypothetical protein
MSKPRRRTRATPCHADIDSAWKQALQVLLPDFLDLVHPDLYAALDWSRPVEFLDKEITRYGRKGRRAADLLANVPRLDEADLTAWLAAHATASR